MHDAHLLCKWLTEAIEKKDDTIRLYEQRIEISDEEKQWLTNTCDRQVKNIKDLENEISILRAQLSACKQEIQEAQKDQREFSKVSQVIQMEKENAKLKADIALLNERLSRKVEKAVDESPKKNDNASTGEVEATNTDKAPSFSVYEKKIKGKNYYISNDDEMIIYDVLEDGDVGPRLGQLIKKEDKTKIVWD